MYSNFLNFKLYSGNHVFLQMGKLERIGFGGGCHWCTEAVFQAVIGVSKVQQGWISPLENEKFSEGVLVYYDPAIVALDILVAIHLYSHSSTSNHAMRGKYRSAIYVFGEQQENRVAAALGQLQKDFEVPLVTKILGFGKFKLNSENFLNYYLTDNERPFCKTYITPKLKILMDKFRGRMRPLANLRG